MSNDPKPSHGNAETSGVAAAQARAGRAALATFAAAALAIGAGCAAPGPAPRTVAVVDQRPLSGTDAELARYGTVSRIEAMQQAPQTSGAGAVIGGVVGGVLGHQVGQGGGKTAATAIGAVGGAVAGNEIERRRSDGGGASYYRITVRVDNGDVRQFDYADLNGLAPGDRVRIEGGALARL